jgi:hypothetical protein
MDGNLLGLIGQTYCSDPDPLASTIPFFKVKYYSKVAYKVPKYADKLSIMNDPAWFPL